MSEPAAEAPKQEVETASDDNTVMSRASFARTYAGWLSDALHVVLLSNDDPEAQLRALVDAQRQLDIVERHLGLALFLASEAVRAA